MLTTNPLRNASAWLFPVLAAVGFFTATMTDTAHAEATKTERKSTRATQPTIIIERDGKCVEDTDVMRRDHMKFILHQRDQTVHTGIRTEKHSLKNCVNCHASSKTNSVLGKEGFCESCHSYASVSIDCFSCHTSSPAKKAAIRAVVSGEKPPGQSLDKMMTSNPTIPQESASTASTGKTP